MDVLTSDILTELAKTEAVPAVSLYISTYRAGAETQKSPIKLKNLIREAENQLDEFAEAHNLNIDSASFMQAATELLDDMDFWQHQSDGLVIFVAENFFQYFRLPSNFEDQAFVGPQFYLKPLLPLLNQNGRFYLLTLSQNNIRLFEASATHMRQRDLGDTPTSMADALWYEEPEKQQQLHSPRPGGKSSVAMYHGQGHIKEEKKTRILEFFQQVNEGVTKEIGQDSAPLLLAGVEYLLPIYEQANNYQPLMSDHITGNTDHIDSNALHERAREQMSVFFSEAQDTAVKQYKNMLNTEQTLASVSDIVTAAYQGRVDLLFVARHQQAWGRFMVDQNSAHRHPTAQPGDEDLLNRAAVETISNGGKVYVLDEDDIPADSLAAALLRY